MTSGENLRCLEGMIVMAGQGDEKMIGLLRRIIEGIAKTCPESLLISLATKVAEYRRDEMRNESQNN